MARSAMRDAMQRRWRGRLPSVAVKGCGHALACAGLAPPWNRDRTYGLSGGKTCGHALDAPHGFSWAQCGPACCVPPSDPLCHIAHSEPHEHSKV